MSALESNLLNEEISFLSWAFQLYKSISCYFK